MQILLNRLHDLKDCLEFSALGSISLINQDFKLKKAVEDFEVYSKHSNSKVLQKIYGKANDLIDKENKANKSQELLSLLALINAVIITQTPNNKKVEDNKDLEELLELNIFDRNYKQIPSKTLNAFNDAIYKSGSGRYYALETILRESDIMNDYRIFQGLIHGLSDRYSEVRDLAIKKLCLCDENVAKYLKNMILLEDNREKSKDKKDKDKIDKIDKIDKTLLLYIINNICDGAEDEYIKNLYVELVSVKKKTNKIKDDILSLASIVSNNKNNLEFFKELYGVSHTYEEINELVYVKLIQMSERYGENYVNCIAEYIIEENEIREQKRTTGAYSHCYCTDSVLTDDILDEFDLKMKIVYDDKNYIATCNYRYSYLYICINKPTTRWYDTMLELIKLEYELEDKKLFFNEDDNSSKDTCKFLLIDIVVEYLLVNLINNKDNVNQEFLDKVYDIIGEDRVIIDFVIDLLEKPSEYVFETYSPYVEANKLVNKDKKINYVGFGILETFSLRLRYLEENNKYMLSDSYYNIIEFKYKHFNSSNTYVNRILEDKHNFKKKELEI
ncbi:MAG: hypothetical protein R3Y29_06505, partial [bacterium]